MNDFTAYPEYDQVEGLRRRLLLDKSEIIVEDFGAGSARTKSNKRKVASIAKNAAKPARFGQLMHRMVRYYDAKQVLELGTSLGITTSYLAAACADTKVTTLEGAEAVAAIAQKNFDALGLKNIEIVRGNFDQTLPAVLSRIAPVDFAFIDGNHRQEPTERYFAQLLPYISEESLLVFDDIHWSKEMEMAWNNISAHESVTCTIDLFYIGIVSFRKAFKEKQNFSVRF